MAAVSYGGTGLSEADSGVEFGESADTEKALLCGIQVE